MNKTAFISGVTGQDGAYLAQLLLEKGYVVHGGVRANAQDSLDRLSRLGIQDRVKLHNFDLLDMNNVFRVLRDLRVDEFYNLAAQSFVGASWDSAMNTLDINAMGAARVLDTLRTTSPETRFYQASTSEMFGAVRAVPQSELTPFNPRSPYAAGKAMAHYLTVNYRDSFGMHASCGILFNHESPLRGLQFVTRKISSTLARIARGSAEVCRLGNMDARRDWGYAPEYVEGMWRMLQQDRADDYVLATGATTTVRDFVSCVAGALGMRLDWEGEGLTEVARNAATGQVVVCVDPAFFRPAEVDLLIGDPAKAKAALGWQATTDVTALATIMARADYDSTANRLAA